VLRSSNEWISKVNTDTERKGEEEKQGAKYGEEQKDGRLLHPDNISLNGSIECFGFCVGSPVV
jgi:NADH:ubiquinone oxidoreductase subunit E